MRKALYCSPVGLVGLAMVGSLALVGCGTDKDDTGGGTSSKHKIGGTARGLVGTGLVLHCGDDDLPVATSGSFTFPTEVEEGKEYRVTVKTQPSAAETCSVAPQSGTMGKSDVAVTVTCSSSSNTFTVGGTVTGVTTRGLVLQNNMGADLAVPAAATSFTFPEHVADGSEYSVTVKTPAGGANCDVASGSGTIQSANVTSVVVTCTPGPTSVIQRWEAPNTAGVVQSYTRNREALFTGSDGAIHLLPANEPRIDATKGFLFGLQGGNLLNSPAAVSEAFNLWTAAGGATVAADALQAPVAGGGQTADTITLPAGASLSTPVAAPNLAITQAAGVILGQIWIRPTAGSGTLTFSGPGGTSVVDLSALTANEWNHVPLNGFTTDGISGGTLTMTAAGNVTFGAWGANLSQICNGGDPGIPMDPLMYDRSIHAVTPDRAPIDVLDLTTAVPQSTATTGFCFSIDAQPADGFGWNVPVTFKRGLMGWFPGGATQATASLYLSGTFTVLNKPTGSLCFYVNGAEHIVGGGEVCGPVPGGWSPGSLHNVKGCLSTDRHLRVYADDQQIGDYALHPDTVVPELQGGALTIGNTTKATPPGWNPDPSVPWNGYVSRALVCSESTDRATMCR